MLENIQLAKVTYIILANITPLKFTSSIKVYKAIQKS